MDFLMLDYERGNPDLRDFREYRPRQLAEVLKNIWILYPGWNSCRNC